MRSSFDFIGYTKVRITALFKKALTLNKIYLLLKNAEGLKDKPAFAPLSKIALLV